MKRGRIVLVCMLLFSVASFAAITKIEIIEGNGFTANFTADGNITWSGGVSATIYDGENETAIDVIGDDSGETFNITATFSQLTDASSGGWAAATFDVIGWRIDFVKGPWSGYIEGTNALDEVYTEEEGQYLDPPGIRINPNQLFGKGIVTVTDWDFYFLDMSLGGLYEWADPIGSKAGLKSHLLLSGDSVPFDDYNLDSYNTVETTMWLASDESSIPEPATMILLGLGSLLALRKRS